MVAGHYLPLRQRPRLVRYVRFISDQVSSPGFSMDAEVQFTSLTQRWFVQHMLPCLSRCMSIHTVVLSSRVIRFCSPKDPCLDVSRIWPVWLVSACHLKDLLYWFQHQYRHHSTTDQALLGSASLQTCIRYRGEIPLLASASKVRQVRIRAQLYSWCDSMNIAYVLKLRYVFSRYMYVQQNIFKAARFWFCLLDTEAFASWRYIIFKWLSQP